MSRYLLLFLFCAPLLGAPKADLGEAMNYCVKNFPKGKDAGQEGFKECVQSALSDYFEVPIKLQMGKVEAVTPTPTPSPTVNRAKEEAKAKQQFKTLVKSVTCQRCHVGLNASQYTLSQMHAVLTTPSHQEYLGPKEQELIKSLGTMVQ